MDWRNLGLAVGLALAAAGPAVADPRLDEVVYSPYVENHVIEIETRLGQEVGPGNEDGARTFVIEAEAGLSDRFSLAVVNQIQREPTRGARLTGVGLEGIYYLGQIPGLGVDTAIYVECTKGVGGENDQAESKLLLAKTAGRFQGLINLIVERPFGAPRGEDFADYGYAASATWLTVDGLRVGFEAFGDLGSDRGFLTGSQGAYVGPQVKWSGHPAFLPVEVSVDAGWLASVGAARGEGAGQARVNLEFEHRF